MTRLNRISLAALIACALAALAAPAARAQLQRPAISALTSEACIACHGNPDLERTTPEGEVVSLYADPEVLRASAHRGLECVSCHRDIRQVPHRQPIPQVNCARCHYVDPLPSPRRQPQQPGLHQAAREARGEGAPGCKDCHGRHDVHSPSAPASRLHRLNSADTCGACHPQVARGFGESVHGAALQATSPDVPACADCHPEHPRGMREERPGIARAGVVATCIACHDDPGLQRRYGLPTGRLATYLGSYHGAATELGSSRTANCASCHDAHFILPSSDPRSTVHPANIPHTCGHCHPGAGVNFAVGGIHLQPSPTRDRAVFWVRLAYQVLIAGLMLAFAGYIGLDLLARARRRLGPTQRPARDEPEPQFERLTLAQRLQHWGLILSFTALIVTGFPLLFPQWGVARGAVTFLGGADARAIIHRAAALMLIALMAAHLAYVLFSRRGYWEFRQLLPNFTDLRNLLHMLAFYFGFTPTRPAFDRYNYIEKFEYFAVAWGSVIMITTGLLLWAPSITLAVLPKWATDIAIVIHGWEAIMAFLAIIIWHMYNVHFNPSVFPMSRIWLTGKIGLHELRDNHPLEYERLLARQAAGRDPAGRDGSTADDG